MYLTANKLLSLRANTLLMRCPVPFCIYVQEATADLSGLVSGTLSKITANACLMSGFFGFA